METNSKYCKISLTNQVKLPHVIDLYLHVKLSHGHYDFNY